MVESAAAVADTAVGTLTGVRGDPATHQNLGPLGDVKTTEVGGGTWKSTFHYRAGSEADAGVMRQIFEEQDYDIEPFPLTPHLKQFGKRIRTTGRVPLVLDVGANIGASALYFHVAYPDVRVLAIEPHPGNCAMFRLNCGHLNGVTLLEGGLACRSGRMALEDPGHGEWGYRLNPAQPEDPGSVPVFGVTDLIAESERQGLVPYVVKIDIEGGEAELFSDRVEWVERVPLIIIELHDWAFAGQARSRNFFNAIAGLQFDVILRGENLFCFNTALLACLAIPAT
jgi:FkbM family methyltransferase